MKRPPRPCSICGRPVSSAQRSRLCPRCQEARLRERGRANQKRYRDRLARRLPSPTYPEDWPERSQVAPSTATIPPATEPPDPTPASNAYGRVVDEPSTPDEMLSSGELNRDWLHRLSMGFFPAVDDYDELVLSGAGFDDPRRWEARRRILAEFEMYKRWFEETGDLARTSPYFAQQTALWRRFFVALKG